MRIDRGNRSTRRKPAPVPLCPPQIPHDLAWDRTRAVAVGSQRLTAWAMARPNPVVCSIEQKASEDVGQDKLATAPTGNRIPAAQSWTITALPSFKFRALPGRFNSLTAESESSTPHRKYQNPMLYTIISRCQTPIHTTHFLTSIVSFSVFQPTDLQKSIELNSFLASSSLSTYPAHPNFLDNPVLSSVPRATYIKILKFKFLKC
jgi:hypothetical protein